MPYRGLPYRMHLQTFFLENLKEPVNCDVVMEKGSQVTLASPPRSAGADLYLELLPRCLTRTIAREQYTLVEPPRGTLRSLLFAPVKALLRRKGCLLVRRTDLASRVAGRDWPLSGETMVGLHRLANVRALAEDVLGRGTPGDFMECGVWRGGVAIYMKAILEVYGDRERRVWLADSFRGLPKPNPREYPRDVGLDFWKWPQLAVSMEEVQENFKRYGLLDERVQFLPGWFRDTLPTAPVEKLALLRIDADLYESTMDALRWLYPKVVVGGWVIIDDYGAVAACRAAVNDFRQSMGIEEPLQWVDWTGVYWQKQK
jgi:O-methyltransferase